ncbi:hypothetical protein B0H11DRAFT_2217535 [Mycena galericulata]|nr:hypothetical protein B0H11DRAFT_2217535 [Mycena galericulata]
MRSTHLRGRCTTLSWRHRNLDGPPPRVQHPHPAPAPAAAYLLDSPRRTSTAYPHLQYHHPSAHSPSAAVSPPASALVRSGNARQGQGQGQGQQHAHVYAHPPTHTHQLAFPPPPADALVGAQRAPAALPCWGSRAVHAAHPEPLDGPACFAAAPVPNAQDTAAAGPSSSSTTNTPPPTPPGAPRDHIASTRSSGVISTSGATSIATSSRLSPVSMKIKIVTEHKYSVDWRVYSHLLNTSGNLWCSKQGMTIFVFSLQMTSDFNMIIEWETV